MSEASRVCLAVSEEARRTPIEKIDRSPVTIADFGSQALILRALYETFPGVSVIAEEDASPLQDPQNSRLLDRLVDHVNRVRPYTDADDVLSWIDWGKADQDPDYFWTLDPIDGTKGFLREDQYAISLCLVVEGALSVAALGCPMLVGSAGNKGILLYAVKGEGAFELPLSLEGTPSPLHVSDLADVTKIHFTESVESAHSSHGDSARIATTLGIQAAPCRIDSQTKYAAVARGNSEAYIGLPKNDGTYEEKVWDHAGGALVVQEAGGRVTDIKGEPLDFHQGRTLKNNTGILATNGLVHDVILGAIETLKIG